MSERPFVDFYQVLGIGPAATPQEVSAAYRSLARKHHPDSSEAEDDSTVSFKTVVEAYETLSDPDKRRTYDRQRQRRQSSTGRRSRPHRSTQQSRTDSLFGAGVFGLFDELAGGPRGAPPQTEPMRASDRLADLPVTPEEARWGASISFTLTISGRCRDCQGSGCSACGGRGVLSRRHPVRVRVPAGIHDGALLRVPGEDCVLRVCVRPYW